MKIILQKPTGVSKAVLVHTTPENFLVTVKKSTFKEGHSKFDQRSYNQVLRGIKAERPILPTIMYVTESGVPTALSKTQGLYVAVAAIKLGLTSIPVYVFALDEDQIVTDKPTHFPKGFSTKVERSTVTTWSAYSWYKFKPYSGKAARVTDIKGESHRVEPSTVFGLLPVRSGMRFVDSQDAKHFFILKEQRAAKFIEQSTRVKKVPIIAGPASTPEPKVEPEPKPVITPAPEIIPEPEPHMPEAVKVKVVTDPIARPGGDDEDDDEVLDKRYKNKVIDVDALDTYNDVDDLSLELFGHHLDSFEGYDFDSMNSCVSSTDENLGLGQVYEQFFKQNPQAQQVQQDPELAEKMLIQIVKSLYDFLVKHDFVVDVVSGTGYRNPIDGASKAIRAWQMRNNGAPIKHLAVKVNNQILDPCFKRLGDRVRINHYPLTDFQRIWSMLQKEAHYDPGCPDRSVNNLTTRPAHELQVPTMYSSREDAATARTKLTLRTKSDEG